MASTPALLSTRVLLVCAAVGVAMGIAGALWSPLHAFAAGPGIPLYGLVLGFHALPGVIVQQVLRQPWVALLTHALAAVISCAFVPLAAVGYITAAVVFGGVQEGFSALTRYRHWETWRFLVAALITGVLLALPLWFAFHVSTLAPWAAIVFIAGFMFGPALWTLVGLGIGTGLRRAGVARR